MTNPVVSLNDERLAPGLTHAVLDPEILRRLRDLGNAVGEDLLVQLAMLFMVDAEERIAELSRAFDHDDHAGVVRATHTLRGSSANLGAIDLGRLCERLEATDATCALAASRGLFDAVVAELARVRETLATLIVTS
jgi:HPt (histidine-containing phosphotransfer) domain-containing protein